MIVGVLLEAVYILYILQSPGRTINMLPSRLEILIVNVSTYLYYIPLSLVLL